MTGEKIIVLRRLDDNATDFTKHACIGSSRPKSNNNEDAWFLGFCEGVVGKFRGAHVQIHGKLKKPVLMRRSRQGQIHESPTRPMSQAATASLSESQASVSLPIGIVEAEGEDSGRSGGIRGAVASNRTSTGRSIVVEASSSVDRMSNGSASSLAPAAGLNTQLLRTGANGRPQHRTSYRSTSQDSDDSETVLPWARRSLSDDSPEEAQQSSTNFKAQVPSSNRSLTDHLEPSPIDSRGGYSTESGTRTTNSGHLPQSPSQDSNITASTDESEDDFSGGSRRDHTLSIYDIYGRDSVAFPNFSLQGMLPPSDTAQSIKLESEKHPTPPLASEHIRANTRDVHRAPGQDVAAKLRSSPSGRRPNAAPDPRAPPNQGTAFASSLRYQVGTGSPRSEKPSELSLPPASRPVMTIASAPGSPAMVQEKARLSGPRGGLSGFDTSIRPTPHFTEARQDPPPPQLAKLRIPRQAPSVARPLSADSSSPIGPLRGIPRPGPPLSAGFAPGSIVDTSTVAPLNGPAGLRGPASSAALVSAPAASSHLPPGVLVSVGPKRASSDRTSERERVSSGQLRKNPSNPSPGSYGGGSPDARGSASGSITDVLSPPGAFRTGSRSPSPLATSPTGPARKLPSPIDPSMLSRSISPAGSASSPPKGPPPGHPKGRAPSQGPSPHGFDAKGFRLGLGPPCLPEAENSDAVAKWREILNENDLAAARKSRKVRKLVRAGIPNSMRGQVWLFLSNASVRRRPGLFEQLCVSSRSVKGKKGREAVYETIEKDVSRTYPDNCVFEDGSPGKADLEAILKAYVHYNPIIGYTQGMGLLVGMFLLHLAAEDAFWLLCALLRDIHMEGYYSNEMKQMHIDGVIFGQLLQTMDSPLALRLQSVGVEPLNFTPNWLLPLFCRVLPWPTLIRAWDVFFYEGPQWILQLSLSIVRIIREPLMAASGPSAAEDILRLLLHPPAQELTPENVLTCALSVKIKDGEMRKLSRSASKLVRESAVARGRWGSAAPSSAGGGSGAGSGGVSPIVTVPSRR